MDCEIILIGNELLIGKVNDTNGLFVINHLVPLGVKISQITIVPDDLTKISETIVNALARKPKYIFTSGGLGPTFDDMTLEGINLALFPNEEMKESPNALDLIVDSFSVRFNKPKEKVRQILEQRYPLYHKMIRIPKGSKPLFNPEGMAPGVLIPKEITNGFTDIFILPGVPLEFESIFLNQILPDIKLQTQNLKYYQCGFTFLNLGESRFTELVYSIKEDYPEIWIKTHPRSKTVNGKRQYEVEVHLTAFTEDASVSEKMRVLYDRLKSHVLASNGRILMENPLIT